MKVLFLVFSFLRRRGRKGDLRLIYRWELLLEHVSFWLEKTIFHMVSAIDNYLKSV